MKAKQEVTRRWVHFLIGGAAYLLPFLDWRVALLVALFALFVNAEVLPRTTVARGWFRPQEGWLGGIVAYPLTVALLLVIFRERTFVVAGAWLTLAAGDPAAAWIGSRSDGRTLPWNPRKTVAGSIAFIVASLPFVMLAAIQNGLSLSQAMIFGLLAAVVGSLIEGLPIKAADNLLIGLGTGCVIFGVEALL